MSQSVYFNGETITIPGAYSATDASGMSTKSSSGAKIVAFVGECDGGEPGVVQFFNDPISAKKVLKSGDLMKACEKAWNPVSKTKTGVKLGGADIIACIRTNKATKSKLEVKKTEAMQLTFESKDYGSNTAHQVKIADGTLKGTKKLVIYDPTTATYENYDNVGNVCTISYTGSAKYAEINTYLDGSKVFCIQTKVGNDKGTAVEDILIKVDPNVYKSIRQVIQTLQSYENYTVSAVNPYNTKLKATDLDLVTSQNIKLGAEEQPFRLTAVYEDMKQKLATSNFVTLTSYDKTKGAIDNMELTPLTGGEYGKSPASWIEFFDMLSNYDVSYIVPLTADVSVHAELVSHITSLSGNLGKERRGVIGGEIGESISDTLARARDIASSRIQVVHSGFWDYNSQNELQLYPPYILAAQHAGRAAYLEDGESATHDVYRMSAPEYKLERNEISKLLDGGVLAFEFVLGRNDISQSYVRLVQDLTTDTSSDNSLYSERATGALADSINREIRDELDSMLTGKRTSLTDLTSAQNRVISILAERLRKGHIVAYKEVSVTRTGTTTEVNYSVAPAEPNNFTLITAHYYSEPLTVTAESTTTE